MNDNTVLLTVVIPCYNQGHFLADAINSAISIPILEKEIIVVDDGSTDETAKIVRQFTGIRYYYQDNASLPAARNKGIELAKGRYVNFLDADDWLMPEGICEILSYISLSDKYAFVSGCHIIKNPDGTDFKYCIPLMDAPPYEFLLQGNYIGNPASVIYRIEILKNYPFLVSEDIKGCEDYEQYLRITRDHPVYHLSTPVSCYRRHNQNMSNNHSMMLNSVLNVLIGQKKYGLTEKQNKLIREGIAHWMYHYDYISFDLNGRKSFQRYHWELFKKYNFRLPIILLRKLKKAYKGA